MSQTPIKTPFVYTSEDFDALVEAFNELTLHQFEIRKPGKKEDICRQVLIPDWPWKVHYEFIARKNATQGPPKGRRVGLCLEFHCEGDYLRRPEILQEIAHSITEIKEIPLQCLKWSNNPSLVLQIPADMNPHRVAEIMLSFIELTRSEIDTITTASAPRQPNNQSF